MCLTFLFMAVNFEFVATQRNLRKKESELGRESARERECVCASERERESNLARMWRKEKLKWVEILFIFR